MSYWKCIKTLKMNNSGEVAFTEGKVYKGEVSATPLGEWAMAFEDDTGWGDHLMTSKDLHEYFVKSPEFDLTDYGPDFDEEDDMTEEEAAAYRERQKNPGDFDDIQPWPL
jgi:hypothetical protein